MKRTILYLFLLACGSFTLGSCSTDKLDGVSVFDEAPKAKTTFDMWLEQNYTIPYNIEFTYRWNLMTSDVTHNLIPPTEENAIALAKLVKFLWIDVYEEVCGTTFLRNYSPKQFQVIGCAVYDEGTIKLGTAEGGQKITLYVGNWLNRYIYPAHVNDLGVQIPDLINVDGLNNYFFKTIHHEFAHILQQTISPDPKFDLISVGTYAPSSWFNRSESEAAQLGFVSPYAGSAAVDDFVEVIACYLTMSVAQWNQKLSSAGTSGAAKINQKLTIVKDYLQTKWNLDLDSLRATLARRYTELPLILPNLYQI
ncbi:MAG: putative zinc-binding metallopeptidase [Rikenellaceae bacterium]|jgi:substrate import-associated zinc metallohydrolase lipoprotein|nr:putative zinc-binding metallopeptidase [Rikenellaceae bacterium]